MTSNNMTSNNNLSSILLLILIGIAIYFLINPLDGFKNVDKIEHFDDSANTNISSSSYTSSEPHTPYTSSEPHTPYTSSEPHTPYTSSEPHTRYTSTEPTHNNGGYLHPDADISNYHDPSVYIEFNNESDHNYSTNPPQMSYDPHVYLTSSDIAHIHNPPSFNPNDDSYDNDTSDLTSAFIPPLPPGSKPDVVDFKKNNVDKYNAADFLPKQVNDEWFETDFSLAKYQLNDDKLINTEKYIIGINTVGESLKNASYDIRGTIPNPKFIVSPWNNSTYEPDFNLKPLC